MNARLSFVHALSPLHAGTGQGVGIIDLPTAREKATGLPFLPGSSLKGALRARCTDKDECSKVFGPEPSNIDSNENQASAVQFSDQRLLLLPIRSLAGTFAWVTSPYILRRLVRDMEDIETSPPAAIPFIQQGNCLIVRKRNNEEVDSKITVNANKTQAAFLEDLDLVPQTNDEATEWAGWIAGKVFPGKDNADWQKMLIERFCVVHDDIFNFLINTATEITARIKMEESTKTVQEGALWYEEALPTETILSGLVVATPVQKSTLTVEKVFETIQGFTGKTLQLGGNATVGRGMCRVQMAKKEQNNANKQQTSKG
jgi:CRISPR-associated protein Cmr4